MFEKILPPSLNLSDLITTNSDRSATAYAPSNIALIKYWGKRDDLLNLPLTDSLSLSLGSLGTTTSVKFSSQDSVILNHQKLSPDSLFSQRLFKFLEPFRFQNNKNKIKIKFEIITENSIPTAAGLASSASGYAALVKALNQLFKFNWDNQTLSIAARLGSGSACRSIFNTGFVHWHAGVRSDGMDSFAEKIAEPWSDLSLGIILIDSSEKKISSREAMKITRETSKKFQTWPAQVKQDLENLLNTVRNHDFLNLGKIAENNALEMHATLEDSQPSFSFCTPETLKTRQKIWELRADGLPIFFTQDAGPNLKLIYLKQDQEILKNLFPKLLIPEIHPKI